MAAVALDWLALAEMEYWLRLDTLELLVQMVVLEHRLLQTTLISVEGLADTAQQATEMLPQTAF